eukprot:CAMPEP_0171328110 /NCGR_PEP_ID=MMETSP0878-20121228/453_1 /TAXON_ID=67004 /ORGANISM="Thalassiosira weissflogii, Strain CCMP1336" /LENGTH=157 /DNA_ID=CAMNT_0011827939 /DNA_START=40 /DNA_END=510 /DNA_ORIENTATION=-
MLSRIITAAGRHPSTASASAIISRSCRRTVIPALSPTSTTHRRLLSSYGDNITYSGGQASEGQGGFYGSGGARASTQPTEHKPEMVALAADVENLTLVMEEVYKLEDMLDEEKAKDSSGSGVTSKTLEISSKIKKIMTSSDVMDCLNRLEVEGEPVW